MSSDIELWPPPDDAKAFESLCLDLWKEIWKDSGAQKNGRSGQSQAGVDVFGSCRGKQIGVQCKQKDGLLWSKLTLSELEREVEEAKSFQPALSIFIVATTGPRDARVQERARLLTEEHKQIGLFLVEVWAWKDIWHEIYQREELLNRIGPVYWRHSHRLARGRVSIKGKLVVVLLFLVALVVVAVLFANNHKPKTIILPVFSFFDTPVGLPSAADGAVSLASIQNRMRRMINITNPNDFPILLRLRTQLPEAILSVKSQYVAEALPDWDEQPVTVKQISGSASNLVVEPLSASDQSGLWKIKLNSIPPHGLVVLDVVTATGEDAGIFSGLSREHFVGGGTNNALNWFVIGDWRVENAISSKPKIFVIPLSFNLENRSIVAHPPLSEKIPHANLVQMRHGRGFRVPGIFVTRGYIVTYVDQQVSWFSCPYRLESTNRVADLRIGLFGSDNDSLEPAILLRTLDGSDFKIGIGTK